MSSNSPEQIMRIAVKNGVNKTAYSMKQSVILGFLAGAFVAFGYLLSIRLTAPLAGDLASIAPFLSAAVFPVGLILTLIAGGELLTGNMMAVPLARLAKKIHTKQIFYNWMIITISNFFGAIFVAYFFGHLLGLTGSGVYLQATIDIANSKVDDTFLQAFISGIGCNWLVALAVWLTYSTDDIAGKILALWFPIMTFVAIGFQHVVANMFVIPAAIFAGHLSWASYIGNFIPVFLGNAVGGSVFVALIYWHVYHKRQQVEIKGMKDKKLKVS